MSAPNLELVPLDRRAGHALIAGSVQVGRCVVPMRFIQPGSRRVAGADGVRRTGRTGRLWALGRRAPSLESPVVPSNGRAARVDIGTPPPLHGRRPVGCRVAVVEGAALRAQLPRRSSRLGTVRDGAPNCALTPCPCASVLWLSAVPQHTHPPAGHAATVFVLM